MPMQCTILTAVVAPLILTSVQCGQSNLLTIQLMVMDSRSFV